jgi:O-antigen ligase
MSSSSTAAGGSRASVAQPERLSAFIMATALLVGGFLIAGGARDDIVSLLIWRPLSALVLVFAVIFHGAEAWRRGKALILFAVVTTALVAANLIPLPPAVWSALPGRESVVAVYRAAGMDLPWQPLSIAQVRTWNALFSLMGPVAMLLTTLVLSDRRHRQLLYICLGLGLVSGIIGMVQAIGPSDGPLYFYQITNNGTSVGLFANRNHQAAVLASLLPLLAAGLTLFKGKPDKLFFHRALTYATAALLVPLVLMTGSRAGIVLSLVGALCAWFWVRRPPEATGRVVGIRSEHRSRLVGVAITVGLLFAVIVISVRTPALTRLMQTDPASELRIAALPTVMAATWRYFPIGSGIGTFVEAYQIGEPDALISERYFNHAHNEFLELPMTGGVPALILLAWAAVLGLLAFRALWRARKNDRSDPAYARQALGRAGLSVILILVLASATDYPLRVPSIAIYATLAAVWCSNAFKTVRK